MLNARGSYALLFSTTARQDVRIGALGTLTLNPGWLIYCGSALGSGGLRARLRHHLSSTAAPRWHLDYLRAHLTPRQVWYTPGPQPVEHTWAAAFLSLPGSGIPLARFGASDCACPAHLFAFPQAPRLQDFAAALSRLSPGSLPPLCLHLPGACDLIDEPGRNYKA